MMFLVQIKQIYTIDIFYIMSNYNFNIFIQLYDMYSPHI